MKRYLTNLITEKGRDLEDEIGLDGQIGLTWGMLVDWIAEAAKPYHGQIRKTLVMIDFKNGDVFHYLRHLAAGMVEATTGFKCEVVEN